MNESDLIKINSNWLKELQKQLQYGSHTPEWFARNHLKIIPFIKNGDTVIDVGCADRSQMAWVKNYLKEKGIEFTLIGIDQIFTTNKYIK